MKQGKLHNDLREVIGVLLEDDRQLEFRMKGYSMFPMLRPGDTGMVEKCTIDELRPGHIVVFYQRSNLVAHRYIRRVGDRIVCKGDKNLYADEPVKREAIVGKLIRYKRGDKVYTTGDKHPAAWLALRLPRVFGAFNSFQAQQHSRWESLKKYRTDFRANFRLASEPAGRLFTLNVLIAILQGLIPFAVIVLVNGANFVYVEIEGKIEKTKVKFRNDAQLMHVIEKIVTPLGRRVDESSPMVDARLPDGSRINAIIPPLALNGPVLTIRKFAEDPFTVTDLIGFGTMSPQIAEFLRVCVESRLNMLISGGTGSGKTTTLNVVSSFIPPDERIVTIEDAAELQLHQEHVVRLESRPPNIEGKGAIVIRDLVRNALRMRPDRIVVGEVRSGEALDMLQAMNTGHDGSITTGHANAPRDMLARLETMVLMAGMDLPLKAVREQIASAIDIIVHQARLRDGSRKIVSIMEIQGMENEVITLQEIFKFKNEGRDSRGRIRGELVSTGIKPKVLDKIKEANIKINEDIFR